MRALDWSRTALGEPSGWPPSLRHAVQLMLDVRMPAWLAWGERRAFLCNDACLPLVRRDPRTLLGASAHDVWGVARPDLIERLEEAVRTGTGRADVNTSVVPLFDDDARPCGALVLLPYRTGRDPAEGRRAFLLALGDTLHDLDDPDAIMAHAAEAVGRHLHVSRCGMGEVDASGRAYTVVRDWTDGHLPSFAGGHELGERGEAVAVLDAHVMRGGSPVAILYAHHDVARVWHDEEAALLREVAERAWAAVGRARAERALRESENRFRLMADGLPVIIWVHDPTGALRFVNQAYCEFFGVTQEQVAGPNWQPLVHPDDEPGYVAAFFAALQTRTPFRASARVRSASGEWRWIESMGAPYFGPDGSYRGFVGCSPDVTDRSLAEEALERSLRRFHVAQDSSLVAFTILRAVRDERGAIVDFRWDYANPAACRVLGRPIERLLGRRLLEELPGNRRNSDLFDAYVRVVESGEPHNIEVEYDADGIVGAFQNVASKLDDGVAIWFLDVTERRRATEELERQRAERTALLEAERAARAEAESAMQAKDHFLATVSHELRTPLSNVVSWSRVLQERFGGGDELLRRGLTVIETNAMLQAQLISDLLDMSRLVAGKVTLERQPVDFALVVQREATAQRPAAEARGVTIVVEPPPCELVVEGDVTRLQQVVSNLLSNGVKFTPKGGTVTLALTRDDTSVVLEVRDTGEGIPPEFLPHVFDRFRQAEAGRARRHGGLGLGLAIVRQLVELHGGTVRVASAGAGHGAAFTVRLPAATATAGAPVSVEDSGDEEPGSLAGLRILAVEDQPEMLEHLQRVLAERGAEVRCVRSTAEALANLRYEKRRFHALVSDIGLPGLDGYELIRRVRHDLRLDARTLPAIAVTAFARDEDRRRALDEGYQAYLTKPWTVGRLMTVLRRLTLPLSSSDLPAAGR